MNIRLCKNLTLIANLNDQIFDNEPIYDLESNICWAVWDNYKPVGFATLKPLYNEDYVFLSRAGILEDFRGNKLHRKLIATRLRWAKKKGFKGCITYIHRDNIQSIASIQDRGFKIYLPEEEWAGRDFIYFVKTF